MFLEMYASQLCWPCSWRITNQKQCICLYVRSVRDMEPRLRVRASKWNVRRTSEMHRTVNVFWMFCAFYLLLSIGYIQHGIARDLPGQLRLTSAPEDRLLIWNDTKCLFDPAMTAAKDITGSSRLQQSARGTPNIYCHANSSTCTVFPVQHILIINTYPLPGVPFEVNYESQYIMRAWTLGTVHLCPSAVSEYTTK